MRTVRWVAMGLAVLSACIAAFLLVKTHSEMVRSVADLSGFEKVDKISSQLTPERFRLLRTVPFLLIALCSLVAWRPALVLAPLVALRNAAHEGLAFLRSAWLEMPAWERIIVSAILLITAGIRIGMAMTEPVQVDEAMTWLLFTSRGPLVAWSYYAAPNNHILHSLFTTVTAWLPLSPTVALRVPSIVAAILAQIFLYPILRRTTGTPGALIGLVLVSFSFPFLYYGYLSRGYMLVLLAFIVAYAATLRVVRNGGTDALVILSAACVVGLFTMPSFLYPAALLYGLAFFLCQAPDPRGTRWGLFRSGLVVGLTTAVLYAPAVLMSGVAAFTSNQWVKPTGRADVAARWWPHFRDTFDWMTGISFGASVVFLVALFLVIVLRGQGRAVARFNLLLLAGSLVIPLVHGVIPFERTWIHLLVPVAVNFGLLAQLALKDRPRAVHAALVLSTLAAVWMFRTYRRTIPVYEYMAYDAREMYRAIQEVEPKAIYCEFVVMGDHLVYELRSRGSAFTYDLSPEGVDRMASLADGHHNVLIVRREAPVNDPRYREFYSDPIQRVYVRKGLPSTTSPGEQVP